MDSVPSSSQSIEIKRKPEANSTSDHSDDFVDPLPDIQTDFSSLSTAI